MEHYQTSPTGEVVIGGNRYPCSYISTDVCLGPLHSIDNVTVELPFFLADSIADPVISQGSQIQVLYHDREYVFPYDRFVEYGPEDIWWAEPHGFGRWQPCVTAVDGMIADITIDPPENSLIVTRLKIDSLRVA